MICHRCHGLTVREPLPGFDRWLWRCINCGDHVDHVILCNRAEQDAMRADLALAHDRDIMEWARWMAGLPAA